MPNDVIDPRLVQWQADPQGLQQFVSEEALRVGVPPEIALAMMQQESGGRPGAVSPKGATGLMQLMPGTARELGVDPRVPVDNVRGGLRYLKQQLDAFGGDTSKALAAYNAGPGAVRRAGGIPNIPETQNYVRAITANAQKAPPAIDPRLVQWQPVAQPQQQEGPDPTEGNSFGKNALIGAGKFFVDSARGVKQMLGIGDQAELQRQIDESKRLDAPLMRTGGGITGNIAAAALTAAPAMFVPGANTIAGSALVGAGLGATSPVATGESRGENALIGAAGGAAGQGIANAVGRAIRPVRGALPNGERAALIAEAERRGIPLSAGQITQSRPLQALESTMRDMPFTAGRAEAFRQSQQAGLNRALTRTFGEDAEALSPEILGRARDRIGGVFSDVSSRNSVTMDGRLLNSLDEVSAANGKAGPLASGKVSEVVDWLRNAATPTPAQQVSTGVLDALGNPIMHTIPARPAGPMSGEQYQTIRSILTRNSKDAYQAGNSQLGGALKGLRNALDDAAERSISPADQAAWRTARKEYANLKTIEKAVRNDGSGEAFAARLAGEARKANPNAFLYGQGDTELSTLAKLGNGILKDSVPNSGTAQRQFWRDLLNGSLLNAGAQLGKGAAGFAIGAPLQRMMTTRAGQQYLTRGLLDQTPAMLAAARAGHLLSPGAGSQSMGLLNY